MCRHFKLHNENSHRALSDAKVTAQLLIRMIEELRDKHNVITVDELLSYHKKPASKERGAG